MDRSKFSQYLAAITASLTLLTNGMLGSWPSPMVPRLEAEDSPIPITTDEAAWLTSVASLTLMVGVFCVPYTVDVIGRKKLLLFSSIPFMGHWLMVGFAKSFGVLLGARIVASIGAGIMLTVCGMYVSEVAEARIRGEIGTLQPVLSNSGTLLIFCIAPYTSISVGAAISGAFVVFFFITFMWMPESPYFLLIRGRDEDAVLSLLRLRGRTKRIEVENELEQMKKAIQMKHETKGKFRDLLQHRGNRRTFLIMVGLLVLQLMSGASTLTAYSTTVFQLSGSSFDSNVSSIILGVCQVVMSVVCSRLVDRFGRRPLTIMSFCVCSVAMAIEGAYFYYDEIYGEVPSVFDWVPLIVLLVHQIAYWCGIGSVLSIIDGEMYHMSVKGLASSVNTVVSGLLGFALKRLFQVITDTVGTHWVFWGFTVTCAIGALYSFLLLPETKGKTFAQINEMMENYHLQACRRDDHPKQPA